MRFKAEVNFDGREVARVHINRLNLESLLTVRAAITKSNINRFCTVVSIGTSR